MYEQVMSDKFLNVLTSKQSYKARTIFSEYKMDGFVRSAPARSKRSNRVQTTKYSARSNIVTIEECFSRVKTYFRIILSISGYIGSAEKRVIRIKATVREVGSRGSGLSWPPPLYHADGQTAGFFSSTNSPTHLRHKSCARITQREREKKDKRRERGRKRSA